MRRRVYTITLPCRFVIALIGILAGVLSVGAAEDPRALLTLPMDLASAREKWDITDAADAFPVTLVDDDVLGRKVLEIARNTAKGKKSAQSFVIRSKEPVSGSYVVEALVRFPAGGKAKPVLSCATRSDAVDGAAAYVLEGWAAANGFSWTGRRGDEKKGAAKGGKNANRGEIDEAAETSWTAAGGMGPYLKIDNVTPFSAEAFRLETEAGLAATPVPARMWVPMRIEVGPTRVRMFFNGNLVADRPHRDKSEGPVTLEVREGLRVAALDVRRTEKDPAPYVCVPLEGRVNDAGGVDLASLGQPRDGVAVQGIPFMLACAACSNDHVDVGQSVYRHRMGTQYTADYDHRVTMPSAREFDPARIMLTVPQRAYARAWLLAASDDRANHTPLVTLRVFKPATGWATDAAVTVPAFTAQAGGANAKAVQVRTRDGKAANLWLIPIELNTAEIAASYPGAVLNIELTKEILPNLAYPDPANYSYQAGGLPSSVRLYGLTLEEAPVRAVATSGVHGNTYTAPEKPAWKVSLRNQTAKDLPVTVKVDLTDPYGKAGDSLQKAITLKPGESQAPTFQPKTPVYGLYNVRTVVSAGNWSQSRDGRLLMLPPDTRKATGYNSPWGVWLWAGGHDTNPNEDENARLVKALGAINHFGSLSTPDNPGAENTDELRKKYGLGADHDRIIQRDVPAWGAKATPTSVDYIAAKREIGTRAKQLLEQHPDFQYVNCFAENSISLRLTHGMPAWAQGLPEFENDAKEQARIRQMLTVANAGAEGVREMAPAVKFLFGHCAPCFALPFFKEPDWNWDLFAGFGLDMPQFERMPERQPRATEPSLLYFLQKELKARGHADKEFVHLESYFPSSHELALGWRGQADSIVRTAVLSLSLGTTKFMHTWSLHDCGDRWGNQHYGCVGLISREPEYNPKPAAAAFATMTRVLDLAKYDGWVETGSRSAFCVRFKDTDRLVYAVWTVRGTRPLEILSDDPGARLVSIDENGNEFPVAMTDGKGSVPLSPTPRWIVVRGGAIRSAQAGLPVYTEAPPDDKRVLDDFETGAWGYDGQAYTRYGSNNWDMLREPVPMLQERTKSDERGSTVWRVTMKERPTGKPCVGFYGVFTPAKPIQIPGKAEALGVYAKGHSQWFRIIYEVTDAKGEVWLSCGQKNAWNSDDIHSWSYLNFDGWRYMEFPLPASAPGDNYREKSTYSWGSSDDGIVDLPLRLTKVIVEMRTDMIYVNDLLPVEDLSVEIDDLMAVYKNAENMTDAPVKLQMAAKDVWRPRIAVSVLPNPILDLWKSGVGDPPLIEKMYAPEVMAAGDQIFVKVKPVEGATKYTVYVSAYEDGRGAKAAGKAADKDPTTLWVNKLQPSIPLYFFASYTDRDGKESKPSQARKTVLRDEFPFK